VTWVALAAATVKIDELPAAIETGLALMLAVTEGSETTVTLIGSW
jgi:hypothetical protein